MVTIKLTRKQIVAIADILYAHYAHENSSGWSGIDPLPTMVEKFFGEPRLTYYPVYPEKKLRDFIRNLWPEDRIRLLAQLSTDDGKGMSEELVVKLNSVLAQVGLKLQNGQVILSAEGALELADETITFLTELDKVGFTDIGKTYAEGVSAFRGGDMPKASSLCCLAFDALFKNILVAKEVSVGTDALGALVTKAVSRGVVEPEVQPVFNAFVSLRNREPQHANPSHPIQYLSNDSTMILVHLARVLGAYLVSRV